MEKDLPVPGSLYKQNCQVRKVVIVKHRERGLPDIGFEVPGAKRVQFLWYPLWQDWARYATLIDY